MDKTKVVQILRTLNEEELERFAERNLQSAAEEPTANAQLLRALLPYFPAFSAMKVDKETIFTAAFPDRPFNGNFLRKQCSYLYQAIKQFLIEEEFAEQQDLREIAFLQQLQKRKCYHLYELAAAKQQQLLEDSPLRDRPHYYHQYRMAELADQHFAQQQARRYDPALQAKSDNLDIHYIAQKLQFCCEMHNRSKIINASYEPRMIAEITAYLAAHPAVAQHPPIAVYSHILKTLQAEDRDDYFPELVELLRTHRSYFSQQEALDLYRYAQNYCIRRINSGQRNYLQSLFELFREQLATGINIINGFLPAPDYKNTITVGLQLGETEWVRQFLEDYKSYLQPHQRSNTYNYNLAVFYYSTKAYDQAITLLQSVQFTDIYLEINSKIILLKIYFLQTDYFAFYYLLDAFKISLSRNKKVAANNRQAFTNFLVQFKKLSRFKENAPYLAASKRQLQYQKLQGRIQQVQPIYDRNWLLLQLQNLPHGSQF